MKQYMLSVIQPEGPIPPQEVLNKIMKDVTVVLQDMKKAGAWVFNAALHPPATATVVRVKDGDALMTDGPYTEGKEHIGGVCIVKAADLDAAMAWGQRMAAAITLPIEVRPFQDEHP
jgi:hypothetical protein